MEIKNKKNSFLESVLYGVCMGIFEVVPGISGGTLALILNIYETLIFAISNLKKDFKNSVKILLPYLLGMGIGVYCFSFVISFLHKKFPMEVNFWLMGLIIGIIPSIASKAKKYMNSDNFSGKLSCFFSFVLTILIMFLINYFSFNLNNTNEIIESLDFFNGLKFMLVGALASFCLMLPGCSGSLIMLVFGTYYSVINSIHTFNFNIIIIVGIGILLGLLIGSKIIGYCLQNFRAQTFFAILGLIIGSVFSPFLNFLKTCSGLINLNFLLLHGSFSIITLVVGVIFSLKLDSYNNK